VELYHFVVQFLQKNCTYTVDSIIQLRCVYQNLYMRKDTMNTNPTCSCVEAVTCIVGCAIVDVSLKIISLTESVSNKMITASVKGYKNNCYPFQWFLDSAWSLSWCQPNHSPLWLVSNYLLWWKLFFNISLWIIGSRNVFNEVYSCLCF